MAKKKSLFIYYLLGGSGLLLVVAIAIGVGLSRRRPVIADNEPAEAVPDGGSKASAAAPLPVDQRCSALHYNFILQTSLEKYKLPKMTVAELSQPLRGGEELAQPRLLKGRATLDTPHLHLATSVEKLAASLDGEQTFRADHLVLSITNKSDVPIAYRVSTMVDDPEQCESKADIPHNAIALRPHQTIKRTECLYHKQGLRINAVEVYEVSDLGYFYLSKLAPAEGGPFDMRVSRGHWPGKQILCRTLPWRDQDNTQPDAWHVLIDFHARHDCEEYSLPRSYRPWKKPGTLPVCGP